MSKVNTQVQANATDICPYCQKEVDILSSKIFKKKPYHLQCYQKILEEAKGTKSKEKTIGEGEVTLLEYVRKLFALPNVPIKIKKEIQDYIDRGMSYENIYLTLYYVYDILEYEFPSYFTTPCLKIVDYKYDEAMAFWQKKQQLQEKSKEYDIKHCVTTVKRKPRNTTKQKENKQLQSVNLEEIATQIEKEEKKNKEKEEKKNKEMQELNHFRTEMLDIQKEFNNKRLPNEEDTNI